jgi:hypothetical protein
MKIFKYVAALSIAIGAYSLYALTHTQMQNKVDQANQLIADGNFEQAQNIINELQSSNIGKTEAKKLKTTLKQAQATASASAPAPEPARASEEPLKPVKPTKPQKPEPAPKKPFKPLKPAKPLAPAAINVATQIVNTANKEELWKPWAIEAAEILGAAEAIQTAYVKLATDKAQLKMDIKTAPKDKKPEIGKKITDIGQEQKELKAKLEAERTKFNALNTTFESKVGGPVADQLPWAWLGLGKYTNAGEAATYRAKYYNPIVTIFSTILDEKAPTLPTEPSSSSRSSDVIDVTPITSSLEGESANQVSGQESLMQASQSEYKATSSAWNRAVTAWTNMMAGGTPEQIAQAEKDRAEKEAAMAEAAQKLTEEKVKYDSMIEQMADEAQIQAGRDKIREESIQRMHARHEPKQPTEGLTADQKEAAAALEAKKAEIRVQAEEQVKAELAAREKAREEAKEKGKGGWISMLPDLGMQKKANELSDYLETNRIRSDAEKKIQILEGKAGESSSAGWTEEQKQKDIEAGNAEAEAALRGLEEAEASGDKAAIADAQERLDSAYEAVTSIQEAAEEK